LEKQSAQTDFWLDQTRAQGVMRRLADHKKTIEKWRGLEKRVADITESLPLAEEDTIFREEIGSEIERAPRL